MTYLLAIMALHRTNATVMEFASVTLWLYTLVSIAIDCRVYFRSFRSLVLLLMMRVPVLMVLLVVPVVVVVMVVVAMMVVVAITIVVVIIVLMVGDSLIIDFPFELVALDFSVQKFLCYLHCCF